MGIDGADFGPPRLLVKEFSPCIVRQMTYLIVLTGSLVVIISGYIWFMATLVQHVQQ